MLHIFVFSSLVSLAVAYGPCYGYYCPPLPPPPVCGATNITTAFDPINRQISQAASHYQNLTTCPANGTSIADTLIANIDADFTNLNSDADDLFDSLDCFSSRPDSYCGEVDTILDAYDSFYTNANDLLSEIRSSICQCNSTADAYGTAVSVPGNSFGSEIYSFAINLRVLYASTALANFTWSVGCSSNSTNSTITLPSIPTLIDLSNEEGLAEGNAYGLLMSNTCQDFSQ